MIASAPNSTAGLRADRLALRRARLLPLLVAGLAGLATAHAQDGPPAAEVDPERACAALMPRPWPVGVLERRLHLRRLEAARAACINHAAFLAALGALWLDDGDAEQARTWLERSLMLDPDHPGVLADHALALAALGEPTALRDLASAWQGQADVPLALRQRIAGALEPAAALRLPAVRLGGAAAPPRSGSRGEAAVMIGYDDNLSFAPRLSELTLTPPEGPIVLPVISEPRRGAAIKSELSWQVAWAPEAGRVLRAGLSANARHAPGQAGTNWYQLQATTGYTRQWNGWSATAQLDGAWFGGALTEPYALVRTRFGAEHQGEHCNQALRLETSLRRQSRTHSADSLSTLADLRLLCRVPERRDWSWGIGVHASLDEPRQDDRPGGPQRGEGASLRIEHRPTVLHRIDLSLGGLRLRDRDGYSPLIENNAVRWQRQVFVSLEFGYALNLPRLPGAESVLQITHYRQSSNLALFRREGASAYAGLRWPW